MSEVAKRERKLTVEVHPTRSLGSLDVLEGRPQVESNLGSESHRLSGDSDVNTSQVLVSELRLGRGGERWVSSSVLRGVEGEDTKRTLT